MHTRQHANRAARLRSLAGALGGVLLALAPIGCHSAPRSTAAGESRSGRSALDALRARAALEEQRPLPPTADALADDASGVRPLPESELAPGSPSRQSLADVRRPWPFTQAPSERAPIDDEARLVAQQRYAQARQKRLDGDAAAAIPDLQSVTRLDPASPEAWRELAEAQLASGRRTAASASFRRAVELGLRDPKVLLHLARDAARGDKNDEALALLLAARDADLAAADPALDYLVHADLADALARAALWTAAREAMTRAADLPDAFTAPTNLRNELADLYRRRAEMWQSVGDWSVQLRDANAALAAYDRAAQIPGADAQALASRRLAALLRGGQPARAALVLADELASPQSCAGEGHVALARRLRADADLAQLTHAALAEIEQARDSSWTPTQRLALARVRAALLPDAAAQRALLAALRSDGADERALIHDLVRAAPRDPRLREAFAIDLVAARPAVAAVLAEALAIDGVALEPLLAALAERRAAEPAVLVHAHLLARVGRTRDALDRVASVPSWSPEARPAGWAALGELAAANGAWDQVERSLAALSAVEGEDARLALARVQRAAQRFQDAVDTLTPLAESSRSAAPALLLAEVLLRAARPADAERAFQRAMERDRFDERAYEGLIALYVPGAPIASNEKLGAMFRALREGNPASRTARLLTVRGAFTPGGWDRAEALLLDMLRPSPPDPVALELATIMWESRAKESPASAKRAEEWLRARAEQHPDSAPLVGALARVLAASGRPSDADRALDAFLVRWPNPTLARLRENIVRGPLQDAPRADQLALARLERTPPSIDAIIETIDFRAKRAELHLAAPLLDLLPARSALTNEQTGVLMGILTRSPLDAKTSVETAAALVRVFDAADARALPLAPVLQVKRLAVSAIAFADEPAKLADAVLTLARARPEISLNARQPVLAMLIERDRHAAAIPFLRDLLTKIDGGWNDEVARDLAIAIVQAGRADDVRSFLALPRNQPALERLLRTLVRAPDADRPAPKLGTDDAVRAEIAYVLASGMSSFGRERESEDTLALAIEYDQTHALANNDLGYNWADRGERLPEAEVMLLRALAADPDNVNIIDSVGWLRYKQGRFQDAPDPSGRGTQEGAVTLLRRAVERAAAMNDENAISHDHLGDALWRVGRRAEAIEQWGIARPQLQQFINDRKINRDTLSAAARVYLHALERLVAKIQAVQAGAEPQIAPLASEQAAPHANPESAKAPEPKEKNPNP